MGVPSQYSYLFASLLLLVVGCQPVGQRAEKEAAADNEYDRLNAQAVQAERRERFLHGRTDSQQKIVEAERQAAAWGKRRKIHASAVRRKKNEIFLM